MVALLNASLDVMFPPLNYVFECFSSDNGIYEESVVLVIPDKPGYIGSMSIIIGGFFLGLATIAYGWVGVELSKTRPSKYLSDYMIHSIYSFRL